jgi:hypothetical protein
MGNPTDPKDIAELRKQREKKQEGKNHQPRAKTDYLLNLYIHLDPFAS